ncbi:MAG TPA: PKD domain-containing protein, partial [Flavisolibacter sp.]|nr:PKD domain-containing protein [Flavisolibacter sp.]
GRRPVIDFTGQPTIACAFQSVQFTDLTNEADEWQWLFGDGSSSTEQNPTHQYSDTGFQSVTLYATNNGCRDSLTKIDYIRIKPPIADFGYLTSCDNRLLFDFRDSSIGATTWFWDFGDGNTSTLQNPVHIYSAYDTYTVSLTVTNDTCSHTYAREIKVINESPDIGVSTTVACNPTSFAFNAIVADPSSISEYRWIFGDGNEAVLTQQQASHQYANSGFYTVRLITTDIYGCQDTVTKPNFIRVNGPVANFSLQNNRGCKGLTVVFDDLSQDDGLADIVSWKWDFGDGNVQTLTSGPFQHTYPDAGDYSVQLTVTDANGCSSDKFIPFFVNTSDPNADFRAVDTLQCPGSTTLFVNSATGNFLNHYWDFGDGQLGYTATPSHVYENNGLYTVKLVIVDNFGCRDSLVRTDYISVSSPAASFSMNDSISSCTPFEVQFTNTSQYYLTSTWDLGGGTSTMQDPVQFYNTPGVYPIRLIVTSPGGCKDTATGQVQVYDTAGSRITYLPLDGCKPLGVDLTATPTGPVDTYTWDFGDGVLVTNTSTVISHVYNSFGNFVPKVILTDPSGCIIPVTGIDTVRIKGATVKFGADKLLLCDSGFISFTDSTLYNDSLSVYNWDFGDGTTSNLENPVHYYTSPGNYSVTLNVLTESACVDTFRLAAPVRVIESPLVSIGGDSVICVNEFINHLGVFERTDTSVVRWSWRFPNGNSAAVQNPVRQQYTTAGNFEVEAIAINSSGCRDTAYKSLLINPLPTVDLPGSLTMQAGFPVQLPATYTSNVISWSWTPGATLNCTECPQPIAAPKFNTRYNVAFADSNGCRNTGQIEVLVICKNANVFVPNTFSPNGDGSNDVFYVRGKGLDRVKSIRVFNRWGEVVFERVNFPVNDAAYGWDGKYKGNKPVADVYVYQVEVFCDNSQIIRFEGNIALIQ